MAEEPNTPEVPEDSGSSTPPGDTPPPETQAEGGRNVSADAAGSPNMDDAGGPRELEASEPMAAEAGPGVEAQALDTPEPPPELAGGSLAETAAEVPDETAAIAAEAEAAVAETAAVMERVDGDLASEMAAAIADEAEAGAGVAEAAEEGQDLAAEMEAALAAEAAAASDATHAAQGGQDLAAEMEAAIAAAESQRAAEASEPEGPVAIGGRPGPDPPAAAQGYKAPDFALTDGGADLGSIELLDDVELDVRIELGRTEMYIEDVLKLAVGSVIELDKLAGDPVDIFVNERLIARGEVLVLNESFCVRINDILSPIPELAED